MPKTKQAMPTRQIYKIINSDNNKLYIGKTTKSLDKRFAEHITTAKRWAAEDAIGKKHPYQSRLYPAMNLHGFDKFKIELIEVVSAEVSLEEREKYWIAFYNATNDKLGYNISPGGYGGPLFQGHTHSKEVKQKASLRTKGKKQSPEFIKRRIEARAILIQNLNTGQVLTYQELCHQNLLKNTSCKSKAYLHYKGYKFFKYYDQYYLKLGSVANHISKISEKERFNLITEIENSGLVKFKRVAKPKVKKSKEELILAAKQSACKRQQKYWAEFIEKYQIDVEKYKQTYYKYQKECPNRHLELIFKLPYNQVRAFSKYLGLVGGGSGHKYGKVTIKTDN